MAEAIRLGRMTDTMDEGFVAELNIKVGDTLKSGDTIAEIETDKATLPLESYYSGKVLYVAAKKGESLKIGGLIAVVGKEGEDFQSLLAAQSEPAKEEKSVEVKKEAAATSVVSSVTSTTQQTATSSRVKISPLAKAIAKEKGVEITALQGSGEDGRIVKRDLENISKSAVSYASAEVSGEESFVDVRVSQMRKTIARRLSESLHNAPHFYLSMDVNMDKAIALRSELNAVLPEKVSFNDIVLKAVAFALRQNPAVNTSWLGDTIRQYNHIHLGMAVAVEEGLVVPVIKFADQKTIPQIAAEAKQLAQKAVAKKILPTEMEGSTFTVSNLGMFGISRFTAIINEPNACILAVGAIRQVPVVKDGKIEVGNVLTLTLSSDHRVVDGAVGSKFLQSLKTLLENPIALLL